MRNMAVHWQGKLRKTGTLLLAVTIFLTLPVPAERTGQTLSEKIGFSEGMEAEEDIISYADYLEGHAETPAGTGRYELDLSSPEEGKIDLHPAREEDTFPSLVWNDEQNQKEFTWNVEVENSGFYEIQITYLAMEGKGVTPQRGLKINGETPYAEAENLLLYRCYEEELEDGKVQQNRIGNDIRPSLREKYVWQTTALYDAERMYSRPLTVYLEKGANTVSLYWIAEPLAIRSIQLCAPETVPEYAEYETQYAGSNRYGTTLKYQSEDAKERNDPLLRREINGDLKCDPYSYEVKKLNVIGDSRWGKGGQSISWTVDIPEDGLYKIGFRCAQYFGDGMPSYRELRIDGTVPFEEMRAYKFCYDKSFRLETLCDEQGNPYWFYFKKGTRTITLTVTVGGTAEAIRLFEEAGALITAMYRDIHMLTGDEPDPDYEYDFYTAIPDLEQRMDNTIATLEKGVDVLTQVSEKKPYTISNFRRVQDLCEKLRDNEHLISSMLGDLYSASSNIGLWLSELKVQPLILDYMLVGGAEETWETENASFWESLQAGIYSFILSFLKDYDSVGQVEGTSGITLDVWIGRGMEWADAQIRQIEEEFVERYGIGVRANVIPQGQLTATSVSPLLLSVVTGTAPDVVLGVDSNTPVEFAIRDSAMDLSHFAGFDSVTQRFSAGIMTPYKFGGGTYALPETTNFQMLFYRTDIFRELGLRVPETWDELYETVIPVLAQNNMDFYYGTGGMDTFLLQHGGNYYTEDGYRSALDTPMAFQAFKEWTELYTNYRVPLAASFFNYFRVGTIPIGIGTFNDYIQFMTIAPDITGKWDIAPIPGIVDENGELHNESTKTTGMAAMILSSCDNPESAWTFLDWWTSEETQTEYGRELESLLGTEARWPSANLESFEKLPWKNGHGELAVQQIRNAKEVPVVLGGYFSGRHLTNAFTRVINSGVKPRDSLEQAVEDINKELRAKQEEYGIYVP